MKTICLYFQVHQPFRIARFTYFDIGKHTGYFNDSMNREVFLQVAEKGYLPTNRLLLQLIKRYPQDFKVAFSISGIALEQMKQYYPEVLASFQGLVNTGNVEILAETYYHSLAAIYEPGEFTHQVKKHQALVENTFHVKPRVFRNTELILSNAIAQQIAPLNYSAVLTEGTQGFDTGKLHYAAGSLKVLLRNFHRTDDLAFRFAQWYPKKAAFWPNQLDLEDGPLINLFMDYETFGEHYEQDTGIFEFMEQWVKTAISKQKSRFFTPSEVANAFPAEEKWQSQTPISWADQERDLSAWAGNTMQQEALRRLYTLKEKVSKKGNPDLLEAWRKLQTSDHFYYMSTKTASDGEVHQHFSPFQSPHEAYVFYMNILSDLEIALGK